MEPTTRAEQRPPGGTTSVPPAGRTWPSLLTLAATTFVVVTGEMLPTAVLPHLAADLGVTIGRAGLLVSAWAATVVVASFPLARISARFERRIVIAGALAVFSAATLVTAVADAFAVAAGSRIVAAAATGLLWATVNAAAAAIVPEQRIGRAAAVVLGGGTLGTVLAVPVAHTLAGGWGWRATFVALAVLGFLAAGAVLAVLAPDPPRGPADEEGPDRGRPLAPVVLLGALGGLLLAAHFAAFTFVTALLDGPAGTVPTSALLLVFGILSVLGVAATGRASDRFPRATVVAVGALVAASLAGLFLLGASPALDVLVVSVWGAASGAVGPAVQTRMMRAAGARHRATAGTLVPVVFNLGIAVGAALGSAVVDRAAVAALPAPATALAFVATGGLALAVRGARPWWRVPRPVPRAVRPGPCAA